MAVSGEYLYRGVDRDTEYGGLLVDWRGFRTLVDPRSRDMEIKRREFSKMLGAAVGGVFAGIATGCGSSDKNVSEAGIAANACKGMNTCKGQGGCKTDKNACKGQNECKGQGGCATAAHHDCSGKNACKGQGGCATGDNGCAGKNSCESKGGCAVPVKH